MTSNQIMTIGAVGFAAFALLYVFKTPGKTVAATTGQQQRDGGLGSWIDILNNQSFSLDGGKSQAAQNLANSLGFGFYYTG